MKKKGFQ
jgi:hypothetical protein